MSGHGSDPRYTHVATTRRKWSRDEKWAIIAELDVPGATVSEVSRRHGIHTSLLFRWRRDLGSPRPPEAQSQRATFLPMTVSAPMPHQLPPQYLPPSGRIEIELTNGRVVRVEATVDADALVSILAALERKA